MKSNKVLLGLFAGFVALIGGSVQAQVDTNFYEMGPANIGGNVSSLVVDMQDASGTTIYAGAVSGGMYVKSDNRQVLQNFYSRQGMDTSLAANTGIWHLVPFVDNGRKVNLPVNCMAQAPDGTILVGTGDNDYQYGSTYRPLSMLGRGIYRYNPNTVEYTLVPGTVPTAADSKFAAVKALGLIQRDGVLYAYAASNTGLYRWRITSDADWVNTPVKVFDGEVDQLLVVSELKIAYFTSGNQLYMIGDATATTPVVANISSSNSAFGGNNTAIKLAVAPSDPSYLYAMVIDENGLMENLYLTRDLQSWSALTTSTVTPFTRTRINKKWFNSGNGRITGALQVDPGNPKHVIMGGSSIWEGTGYVENSYYQWTKVSYCEQELNGGNYMSHVFSIPMFVHSGINQILSVYRQDEDGIGYYEYFIATEGGVYSTDNFVTFDNLNRGMNNVQINGIAVSPDGSIVSGAFKNGCPMIESRMGHNGGTVNPTWYDNGTLGNLNHDANILWEDNGGKVAASMFQELAPMSRRTSFVSSRKARFGRAYADYLDFTNTQTWTSGTSFASNLPYQSSDSSQLYLWETDHDTYFNVSITVTIDTLGYCLRPNTDGGYDTVNIERSNFQFRAGDKLNITSKANSDYPFEYTFTRNHVASKKLKVKNPLQARTLLISTDTSKYSLWTVYMSWRATDFTKVWDRSLQGNPGDDWSTLNLWLGIYVIDTTIPGQEYDQPRTMAMSSDGRAVYIAVQNLQENKSMLVRVRGFENANYSAPAKQLRPTLLCKYFSETSILQTDTLMISTSDGNYWFPRVISSITVDTTEDSERLLLTFEGYNGNYGNLAIVNNVLADNWSVESYTIANAEVNNIELPAYSAMVEEETGDIYVGTADGVWIKNAEGWSQYDHLAGVAVTSMVQQKAKLPVRRVLTHNGINPEQHIYAKTKWPGAMYFGTYGRGIFMDLSHVTDRTNEVCDPEDYPLGIPTVRNTYAGSVNIYPNPVSGEAHLSITAAEAGNAQLRIYDLNGRCLVNRPLGHVDEGEQTFSVGTEGMAKGMYLVNVIIGGNTATAKMMVR